MKIPSILIFLSALMSVGIFYTGDRVEARRASGAAVQGEPPKFALLVGINEYKKQPNGINNLGGTHNDVALMKSLLGEKGFIEQLKPVQSPGAPCGDQTPQSAVKTLCSAQATKQAILDGFDTQLIKNAESYWKGKPSIDPSKGPQVVFYYSGHGSKLSDTEPVSGERKEDLKIDEADGLDETLVPHDTDLAGTRDIRDDEFDTRIEKLRKFTTNIVFMADSCHSGTITRGAGKKGFERDIAVPGGLTRSTASAVSNDNIASGDGYVTISGSLPTQYSYEDTLDDLKTRKPQRNGLLTYYFVNFVRQNPNASYREVINLVRNATNAAGRDQTPQAEGDIDRGVFGASGPKVKTPIFVRCDVFNAARVCSEEIKKEIPGGPAVTMHKVRLDVGTVVGARVGGPVIIYAPDAKDVDDKLGSGTIVAATKFTSEVEITIAPGRSSVPENSKAVLVAPSFTDEKRTVAIDTAGTDAAAGRMRELAASLQDNAYVTPLQMQDVLKTLDATRNADPAKAVPPNWDAAVVRGSYADFKAGRLMAPPKKDAAAPSDNDQGYFITNRDGMPLYNFWVSAADEQASAKLEKALEQHVRYENTRALGNEANDLASRVEVKLVKIKQFESGAPCTNILASPEDQATIQKTPRLRAGDRFYFTVTNNSDSDLMVYILNLGASGRISLLYPPATGARETLKAGNSINTLGKDQCRHFYIPAEEQYGRESIKIIATDTEIPASLLTMDSIQLRTSTKSAERGSNSPLAKLLRQTASQTRDVAANDIPASGWATVNFDYEIVP